MPAKPSMGHLLLFVGVIAPAFAACTGPSDSFADPSGLYPAPLDAGQLSVLVVDEELVPVAGARVTLVDLSVSNFTGDDGRVRFFVPAGSHRLRIESYGHSSVDATVDVAALDVSELTVRLIAIATVEPYKEVRVFAGMSSCTVPLVFGIFDFSSACQNLTIRTNPVLFAKSLDGWAWLAQELTWQGTHWFTMITDNSAAGPVILKHLSVRHGPAPVRVTAFPGQVAVKHNPQYFEPYPAANTSLRIHVAFAGYFGGAFSAVNSACNVGTDAGCMGVGTAVESRFTIYLSIFFHAPPSDPDAYSALPDK